MNYEFYEDMNNMNVSFNSKSMDLFNPYEGFLCGNALKNEYIPYKNYNPSKIKINSEKEEMLFNISEYYLMMHDINLYLDIYPNDSFALNKFNEYRNKVEELTKKYERKYGPLVVSASDTNNYFNWVLGWPWVI